MHSSTTFDIECKNVYTNQIGILIMSNYGHYKICKKADHIGCIPYVLCPICRHIVTKFNTLNLSRKCTCTNCGWGATEYVEIMELIFSSDIHDPMNWIGIKITGKSYYDSPDELLCECVTACHERKIHAMYCDKIIKSHINMIIPNCLIPDKYFIEIQEQFNYLPKIVSTLDEDSYEE